MNRPLLSRGGAMSFLLIVAASSVYVGLFAAESSAQTPLEFRYEFDTDQPPLVDSTGQNADLGLITNGPEHRFGEPSLIGGNGFSIGLDAPGNNHPTGSYLTVVDAPHPETFSFSIWVKPLLTGQMESIFARDNVWWPSPCAYYCLYIDPFQSLVWKTGGADTILSEEGTIEEDEIYHLVVTHLDTDGPDTGTADRSRLYVNGEMIEEVEDPEEIPSLDSIADTNDIFRILWLGTLSSRGGYWGEMDDFQFYSTELTPEQVAAMYADPGSLPFEGGKPALQPGDADQDLDFDQLDLVRVQIAAKYLTGNAATWGEGDWDGAPGGSQGSPPAGDGQFNQLDVIAALNAGVYLTGPYAAVAADGTRGDGQTSVGYDPATGELFVDAPAGVELTSVNIDSASGIFTGDAAQNLGGSFDHDADDNIFKATFGDSFGSLSFGNVAQAGLSEAFVLGDLSVVGSLSGGGDLGDVDLIYVPEPASLFLLAAGLIVALLPAIRAGRARGKDCGLSRGGRSTNTITATPSTTICISSTTRRIFLSLLSASASAKRWNASAARSGLSVSCNLWAVDAASASRRNRSTSSSEANCPARTSFNATTRLRLNCWALYTIPIPPRAISSSNS